MHNRIYSFQCGIQGFLLRQHRLATFSACHFIQADLLFVGMYKFRVDK